MEFLTDRIFFWTVYRLNLNTRCIPYSGKEAPDLVDPLDRVILSYWFQSRGSTRCFSAWRRKQRKHNMREIKFPAYCANRSFTTAFKKPATFLSRNRWKEFTSSRPIYARSILILYSYVCPSLPNSLNPSSIIQQNPSLNSLLSQACHMPQPSDRLSLNLPYNIW